MLPLSVVAPSGPSAPWISIEPLSPSTVSVPCHVDALYAAVVGVDGEVDVGGDLDPIVDAHHMLPNNGHAANLETVVDNA